MQFVAYLSIFGPVFKHVSETGPMQLPFEIQIIKKRLNNELLQYSDPHLFTKKLKLVKR